MKESLFVWHIYICIVFKVYLKEKLIKLNRKIGTSGMSLYGAVSADVGIPMFGTSVRC